MIKLGTNSIGQIYLGSNSIGKAYLGSNLVYQKGSSPTPPTPVEPIFYDRLVFDGTAYIDTDIVPIDGWSFKVLLGLEETKAAQMVFLAPASDSTYFGMIYASSTSSTNRAIRVYYGSTAQGSGSLAFSTTRYNFFLTPYRYGWGSTVSSTYTKGSGTATGGITIGQHPGHTGQAFTGAMETFYIYGSDASGCTKAADFGSYTPLYTLRPCTYNGEAGYWCVETSTFYGNTAGAGTLSVENA